MNSVYESIIAGLNEAIEDAANEDPKLQRHTVSLPDDILQASGLFIGENRADLGILMGK